MTNSLVIAVHLVVINSSRVFYSPHIPFRCFEGYCKKKTKLFPLCFRHVLKINWFQLKFLVNIHLLNVKFSRVVSLLTKTNGVIRCFNLTVFTFFKMVPLFYRPEKLIAIKFKLVAYALQLFAF